MQVRALVDLLPQMEVVEGDPFNSHPTNTALMGPDALDSFQSGRNLTIAEVSTPLVSLPIKTMTIVHIAMALLAVEIHPSTHPLWCCKLGSVVSSSSHPEDHKHSKL